jgi:hypothetical protein
LGQLVEAAALAIENGAYLIDRGGFALSRQPPLAGVARGYPDSGESEKGNYHKRHGSHDRSVAAVGFNTATQLYQGKDRRDGVQAIRLAARSIDH